MTHAKVISLIVVLAVFPSAGALRAGPLDVSHHPHPEHIQMVHEAEHTVDKAWEIYHRAALGGTIASPLLQAEIEQHLHDARTLVSQAQQAADGGDKVQVERLVGEIKIHTAQAIEGSKEQKQ